MTINVDSTKMVGAVPSELPERASGLREKGGSAQDGFLSPDAIRLLLVSCWGGLAGAARIYQDFADFHSPVEPVTGLSVPHASSSPFQNFL